MTTDEQMLTVTAQGLRHLIIETLRQLPLTAALHANNYLEAETAVTDLLAHLAHADGRNAVPVLEQEAGQSQALCLALVTQALTTLRILPTSALLSFEGRGALGNVQRQLSAAQLQLQAACLRSEKSKIATYDRH